jgi:hypothetical protein
MKKHFVSLCLMAIVALLLPVLSGCSDDDVEGGREVILVLSSEVILVSPTNPISSALDRGVEATVEGTDEKYYLALDRIEGFEYVEGYEYRLKVRITSAENPSILEPAESFRLIEILSKEKVD